jgi:signal transduction histidine kinase
MLSQIIVATLTVAVVVMVCVDLVRTGNEELSGHHDGGGYEVRPTIGGARGDLTGASLQESFGTGIPAGGRNLGLGQQPGRMDPAAVDRQPARTDSLMGQGSSPERDGVPHGDGSRHVRSRLQLLVVIPVAAVTVIALCIVGLAYFLNDARIHAPDGSVRVGSILWAIAIVIVMSTVLVLAAWATIGTAKSVLQPLYRLRSRAMALVGGRPSDADAVPADLASPDEIGDIARAFEQMRSTISRLGGNEAGLRNKLDAMFVNLSHRGQSLVERQMRLIEILEQSERDRERQAILFRMNRIAARMHRDSQNLLILAGHELSSSWNQPMVLMNVVRAAVSEIEEYDRVSVDALPDIALSGPAVNEMVHLLAELIQNATSFSAVDMPVEIAGQLPNTGGALISITDRGVGMSVQDISYANWRLENPPPADIDVPKWIGLLVVSRLAARRGVRVRLQHAELGGLAALVWIPDELIGRPDAAVRPDFTRPGPDRPRRGAHELAMDLHGTGAQRSMAATWVAEPTATREGVRSAPLGRRLLPEEGPSPEPSRPSAGPEPMPQKVQTFAADAANIRHDRQQDTDASAPGAGGSAQLTSPLLAPAAHVQQEANPGNGDVIVPAAVNPAEERRLPIFEAVESSWFKSARQAPGSARNAVKVGGQWSSPADAGWRAAQTVESPAAGSATEAGLPRRLPNANLVPGTIPGSQPPADVPSRSPADVRNRLAGFQRGVADGRAAASEAGKSAGENESLSVRFGFRSHAMMRLRQHPPSPGCGPRNWLVVWPRSLTAPGQPP